MSLLNSASLVVTPNAYKEGTLYSVIPNTTLGDMTVVRATTATRVNSAGLIELVPYNLLQYSEQFDNAAWTKARGSVTANATIAPNGTTTADKFVPDTQVNPHFVSQNASNLSVGGVYTSSVYAKISEWNSVAIFRTDSAVGVSFRLDTQVATVLIGAPVSYSITSVGSGWFRLDVCFTAASASDGSQIRVGNNSSYGIAGNNSDGLFLWGAQLVEGSVAKDYQKTETRLNIPRLDYSNGSCPSLLVEPQRTNLRGQSNDFNGWSTKVNVTTTANYATSPDGTQNASRLQFTANGFMYGNIGSLQTNGTTYTLSCYAKRNGSGSQSVGFFVNGSGSIDSAWSLTSEWQRFTYTYTASNSSSIGISGINGADVSVYGFQFEAGSYQTSYIPTTSAAVTRNADVISKTGISSLIGQTEGTILWDIYIETPTATDNENILNIDNGSFGNTFYISKSASSTIAAEMYSGGVVQASFTKSSIVKGRYKCAFAYANNNTSFFVNGVQVGSTDTSCSVPATNRFQMGLGALGASTGFINLAALFPTRLTNAELISLTTI